MAKSFFITNASRSSGKTTTALNLGLCFVTMGKKVLIISFKSRGRLKQVFNKDIFVQHLLTFMDVDDVSRIDTSNYDYVLVDVDYHNLAEAKGKFPTEFKCIIPFEVEFYGFEDLSKILEFTSKHEFEIEGILPVLMRSGKVSDQVLEKLKENLGQLVLDSFIPRNFYLAKQFDHELFELEKFTEKAGITYLNLANELIDRDKN